MQSFRKRGSSDSQSSVVNVTLGVVVNGDSDFFADLLPLALPPFSLGDDGVLTAAFSSRFVRNNRRTYSWSVATKWLTDGARARATRAEMPQPSSATTEAGERIPCVRRGFVGEEIQSAKRGVIFQRTRIEVSVNH